MTLGVLRGKTIERAWFAEGGTGVCVACTDGTSYWIQLEPDAGIEALNDAAEEEACREPKPPVA